MAFLPRNMYLEFSLAKLLFIFITIFLTQYDPLRTKSLFQRKPVLNCRFGNHFPVVVAVVYTLELTPHTQLALQNQNLNYLFISLFCFSDKPAFHSLGLRG